MATASHNELIRTPAGVLALAPAVQALAGLQHGVNLLNAASHSLVKRCQHVRRWSVGYMLPITEGVSTCGGSVVSLKWMQQG